MDRPPPQKDVLKALKTLQSQGKHRLTKNKNNEHHHKALIYVRNVFRVFGWITVVDMADLETVLALFVVVDETVVADIVAREINKSVIVLLHRKERQYKTDKLLNSVAFLFRDRLDLHLIQSFVKDAEPSITVYKNSQPLQSLTLKTSLADRIHTLIEQIGYSPDCPNSSALKHYLKPVDYIDILSDIDAYLSSQRDFISNTANVSAIIWHAFILASRPINWVGFYYVRKLTRPIENHQTILILGAFQGKKACHTIHMTNGVCGAAARTQTTQRISDVHLFEGHIACDSASESEIVVPVMNAQGELVAVLDMDCPEKDGFSKDDQRQLEYIAKIVGERSDWYNLMIPYTE